MLSKQELSSQEIAMKQLIRSLVLCLLMPFAVLSYATEPGKPAPALSLADLDGKSLALSDLKGKWIALEWTNPECPFVKKHYDSGNMQSTQQHAAKNNIVWIQINSTNPSHPEYKTPTQMKAWNAEKKAAPAHATLDQQGRTGKAYGAKTTPQIVLINPQGVVVYNGAIDSVRSANPADIAGATNYVKQAISEIAAGKPISQASTRPYGCSIKY
jgi:hypothetical protein